MLTKEHKLWHAFMKSYSCMLPIAHVIAEMYAKDGVAQVVAVKVEPERVDDVVALVDDKQNDRRIASATDGTLFQLTR